MIAEQTLTEQYLRVRAHSEAICRGLETEDYVVQPIADVSPPKWHLGHTTWFWETFVLQPNAPGYRIFHEDFSYVFNSYYETVGKRVLRTDRGNLSRPTVTGVYTYRAYVDEHMSRFLDTDDLSPDLYAIIQLGLNHEQQHQELLITDIKYSLGHNPLLPSIEMPINYPPPSKAAEKKHIGTSALSAQNGRGATGESKGITISEGIYAIGHPHTNQAIDSFYFDNEISRHKVYLNETTLASSLTTNAEYLAFIEAGGYQNFRHWLSDGWAWVKANHIQAPLYWHNIDGEWWNYTFEGLVPIALDEPVCHVSQYEADAYARWRGQRLPTEFEWEAAADQLNWGTRWEWTNSAYLPYPGFITAEGAVGEYNGKFMSGQIVLRGASVATPEGHSRPTYRNFFQPDKRWQFTGIRLAK
ncbi:ergothioneine biosynthesis protein EgtB [Spirosoma oryzicola]|uniref:ergothioneine biosynthesis protein EgtB n=1 Tax=Spirosoma oryzicola TaxID=2898794 RepID=UPI001E3985C8|nr:ergothioneine biosynthesis protein EgtB [Spirosoma oryzicola]UHG91846.1 ergothioneine biosynthesis protein EgtB [Spirosoma oryzicola]